jgi:hypothetical protein
VPPRGEPLYNNCVPFVFVVNIPFDVVPCNSSAPVSIDEVCVNNEEIERVFNDNVEMVDV